MRCPIGKFAKVAAIGAAAWATGGASLAASGAATGFSSSLAALGGTASTGLAAAGSSLAGIGGATAAGSSLFGGSLLSYASTGLSVASKLMGGQADKRQYEAQARTERFNATTREIDRKKNLIRALAIGNVKAGAGGTGTGGSNLNVQMQDIHAAEQDQFQADVGSRVAINTAHSNASNAQSFSLLSAAGDVGSSLLRSSRRGSLKKAKS